MTRGPSVHAFTLLEMVAVIAIMMLVLGVAATYVRSDRTQAKLNGALHEFELFCAKVRARVLQDGIERKLVFDPDTREFRAEALPGAIDGAMCRAADLDEPDAPMVITEVVEEEDESALAEYNETPGNRAWKFPDTLKLDYRMDDLNNLADREELELWRYRRDGTAQLNAPLIFYLGNSPHSVTVSEFTGLVKVLDRDVSRENEDFQ